MLLRKYLLTLLPLLAAVGLAASFLPFATHSHVLAGATVDDTFTGSAIAYFTEEKFPAVEDRLAAILQEGTTFVGTGGVQVTSSRLEIPNSEFTRSSKGYYAAPAIAHVQWTVPAGAAPGTQGGIEVHYAAFESKVGFPASFDSPRTQIRQGQRAFREITVHPNFLTLFAARWLFGLTAVLPFALVLHSVWWRLVLRRERRARLPGLLPPEPLTLPVTFHPDPISEWRGYTFVFLCFSVLGAGVLLLALFQSYVDFGTVRTTLLLQGVGLFLAVAFFRWLRRGVVTLQLDPKALSFSRGRGSKQWLTSQWVDLRAVRIRTAIEKGVKHEWIEIEFHKGQVRPIYHKTILNYPLVRDTLLALFAQHHPPAK